MLSRIAFLRIVGVIAVLTVGGVAGAKMRHYSASVSGDVQLAAATAPADAAATSVDVALKGHAVFPLGVPHDVASHSDAHATAQAAAAVEHLGDLEQLRTAGSGAIAFGAGANSRNGGSSSAFGHGFAGSGASFGSVGMGGGTSQSTNTKKAATVTAAAKTPTAAKPPAASAPAPRTPSAAPPVAAPAPAVVPPTPALAVIPPTPTVAAPVTGVSVVPPIFSSQTTPIPAIPGTPKTDPAPLTGGGVGGAVASKGPSLSPTPEPASLLLIATGLAAVIGASRRRQPRP